MTPNQRRWSYVILLLLLIIASMPFTTVASTQHNEMLKVTLTVYA